MDQSNLFDALRTYYPTEYEDGEPSEYTKTEHLTKEQFSEILKTKQSDLDDLAIEVMALSAYQKIKFTEEK
jgi:hypothetical protein